MTAAPIPDDTPGEFIVVAKVSAVSRVPMAPVHTTFGAANDEAIRHARNNPGLEITVFQARAAHMHCTAGEVA